jgi:hypothetical protein
MRALFLASSDMLAVLVQRCVTDWKLLVHGWYWIAFLGVGTVSFACSWFGRKEPYDLAISEIRLLMIKSTGNWASPMRRWRTASAVSFAVMLVGICGCSAADDYQLRDTFTGLDGFVASSEKPSNDSPWMVTSGSLFRAGNAGWTGRPDDGQSPAGNGSAVFRMVSKERDFGDVTARMWLRVSDFVTTDRTPSQAYDGAHVWVRYQSEYELYAVSVDRRDDTMIVKKKCPGGPSNGGTYVDIGEGLSSAPVPLNRWQQIEVTVRNLSDGSVAISGYRDGFHMDVVDRGVGCSPLRAAGGVGLRGDNAELWFDDIEVKRARPLL